VSPEGLGNPGPAMKKVMIDTHILDCIHDDPDLEAALRGLVHPGRLALLITHLQKDEVEAMPQDKTVRRQALLKLIEELVGIVASEGAVFGVSRFGGAKFGGEANIEALRGSRRETNPTRDALIFNTATRGDIDMFVTDDERRAKRLRGLTGAPRIADCADFKAFVLSLRDQAMPDDGS